MTIPIQEVNYELNRNNLPPSYCRSSCSQVFVFFCIISISHPASAILISFKTSFYYWFKSRLTLPIYISTNSIELLLLHNLTSPKSDTISLLNLCQTAVPIKWHLVNFHFHDYFWGCTSFHRLIAIPVS